MPKRQAYFDNASTITLDKRVLKAMMSYFTEDFGNASNLCESGHLVRKAVVKAQEQLAKALNFRTDESVFTGSATEADNEPNGADRDPGESRDQSCSSGS